MQQIRLISGEVLTVIPGSLLPGTAPDGGSQTDYRKVKCY
jgi:hypothetical protein